MQQNTAFSSPTASGFHATDRDPTRNHPKATEAEVPGAAAMVGACNPPHRVPSSDCHCSQEQAGKNQPAQHAMSKEPEFELDLDLQLLPEWARQTPTLNKYADYQGEPQEDRRRGGRPGRRPPRGERSGERPSGRRDDRPRGPDRPRPSARGRERGRRRGERRGAPPETKLPELEVHLVPDTAGVDSLARQIKLTGRAYPLMEIAKLLLGKQERFHIQLKTKQGKDAQPVQRLYLCSLDNSIWLDSEQVARHVLEHHFDTLYQTEKIPADPPKGTYTLVAQCPFTKTIFGPPNLHDYNDKVRRFHAKHFPRMPFDAYKAKIRMVTDEAVVKQWIEEQSFRLQYTALNVPEPLTFDSREAVEAHFREVHLPNLAREVTEHSFPAAEPWPPMPRELHRLIRKTIEDQRRFPLDVGRILSTQFARHGLQFFKVDKAVHVCVARPHYLDLENTAVSDGVRRIVDYIREHPGCTRRDLLEALAPAPATEEPRSEPVETTTPPETPGSEPGAATEAPSAAESAASQPAAGQPADTAPATAAPSRSISAEPTPEQAAVIADLHWLIHQGHVIEFTNGRMELAKPKAKTPSKAQTPSQAEPSAPPASSAQAAPSPSAAKAETEPTESQQAPSTKEASAPAPPVAETSTPTADSAGGDTVDSQVPEPAPLSAEVSAAANPIQAPATEEDLSASTAEVLGGCAPVPTSQAASSGTPPVQDSPEKPDAASSAAPAESASAPSPSEPTPPKQEGTPPA